MARSTGSERKSTTALPASTAISIAGWACAKSANRSTSKLAAKEGVVVTWRKVGRWHWLKSKDIQCHAIAGEIFRPIPTCPVPAPIENTRLFEEVQGRTRELTQSLEQETATSHQAHAAIPC